jgi:hypothetical protein
MNDFLTVGLGTQDTREEAQAFDKSLGTNHVLMLWDPSFESWQKLGIAAQPAGMLFAADGKLILRFQGRIPEAKVLKALGLTK